MGPRTPIPLIAPSTPDNPVAPLTIVEAISEVDSAYDIVGVDDTLETFTIAGDLTTVFYTNRPFSVQNSSGNDGDYTVVSSVYSSGFTTIAVAEDIVDATVDGVINIDPTYSNSFIIQPATYVPFIVAGVSTGNNQLVFSMNYTVTGTNIVMNQWEIYDPDNTLVTELTTGTLPKTIFISTDTGLVGNGRYTVTGTPSWSGGPSYTTTVEVVETIPVPA